MSRPSKPATQSVGLISLCSGAVGKIVTLLARFRRDAPRGVLWPVSGFIAAKVSRTVAFLLPIKVILLAGSPGVPSYFQSFIAADSKPAWIVGLVAASVIVYGVALGVQRWADHRASLLANHYAAKSRSLLTQGNENLFAARQMKRVLELASETMFVVLACLVVGIVNMPLLLCSLVLIGVLFIAWTIAERTERWRDAVYDGQRRNFLLSVCSQIVFLAAFFVLILQLLFLGSLTVFGALVSLIFMRQIDAALITAVKLSIEIISDYGYLEALVEPGKPVERRQPAPLLPHLPGYEASARHEAVHLSLGAQGISPKRLQLVWLDDRPGGILQYDVEAQTVTGLQRARWRLFGPPARHHWTNETFLFEHVDRRELGAAVPIDRFEWQSHDCDLLGLLAGDQSTTLDIRTATQQIYNKLAGFVPPRALTLVSEATHPSLQSRLDEVTLARMEVALNAEDEQMIYEAFTAKIAEIRETLSALPQMIYTRHLVPASVDFDCDNQPILLHWFDWMIVPVGTGLSINDERALSALKEIVQGREDGRHVSIRDLKLAALINEMEGQFGRNSYAAMFPLMDEVVGLCRR